MAIVGVDDGSLQVDSQPKSVGLVWGLEAWCYSCCFLPQLGVEIRKNKNN